MSEHKTKDLSPLAQAILKHIIDSANKKERSVMNYIFDMSVAYVEKDMSYSEPHVDNMCVVDGTFSRSRGHIDIDAEYNLHEKSDTKIAKIKCKSYNEYRLALLEIARTVTDCWSIMLVPYCQNNNLKDDVFDKETKSYVPKLSKNKNHVGFQLIENLFVVTYFHSKKDKLLTISYCVMREKEELDAEIAKLQKQVAEKDIYMKQLGQELLQCYKQ